MKGTVREKARKCLAQRENAENLTTLGLLTTVEVTVSLELHYWLIAIVVTLAIFAREGTLLVFYAEEAEKRVEEAVARALARERERVPIEVPAED